MGYRKLDPPKPKPRRTMQKTTTALHVYTVNGGTCSLAIPCWYKEVVKPRETEHHCRDWHDHIGWPDPRRPDMSCQEWDFAQPRAWDAGHHEHGWHHHHYVDLSHVIPIHLLKEGYTGIKVKLDTDEYSITPTGEIDENEDWTVRVYFDVNDETAVKKDLHVGFTVFAISPEGRDVVAKGMLHVQRGAMY